MLEAPYLVGSVVCILKSRCYTIDGNRLDGIVVDKIGQCNISDCALVLLNRLKKSTGVIGLKCFVGSLIFSVQCPVLKQCSGSGRARSGNQKDLLIRSADFLPVGDLSGKDVNQLIRGQIIYAKVCVDNRCHGNDAYLMIHKTCCDRSIQLLFRENIRVSDINGSVCNLLQTLTGSAAVYRHGAVRICIHELLCCCLCKREQGGRACCGNLSGNSLCCLCRSLGCSGFSRCCICCGGLSCGCSVCCRIRSAASCEHSHNQCCCCNCSCKFLQFHNNILLYQESFSYPTVPIIKRAC